MTKGQDRADNTKTASHDETFRPPRRVQFMIYVRLLTNVLFMLDVYVAVHGHVMACHGSASSDLRLCRNASGVRAISAAIT